MTRPTPSRDAEPGAWGSLRPRRRSERRLWLTAFLLAILLHTGFAVTALRTRMFAAAAEVRPVEPPPIRLVFAPPQPASEDPNQFTELPPEAADEAPEHPDFLSNVTSRARDRTAAAEDRGAPALDGRVDAPQVALSPGEPAPSSPPPEPAETADRIAEADPRDAVQVPEGADADRASVRKPERATSPPPEPDPSRILLLGAGTSDILQEAMRNPDGGAVLSGGISLNTTAWDYAPWLQWFRREFLAGWSAPYAYRMGMIDGWHVIELVILPDGTLKDMRVLEEEGHESLVRTSMFCLKTMAPYKPLPDDFPEDALILHLKLVYPPLERRPQRAAPDEPPGPRSGP